MTKFDAVVEVVTRVAVEVEVADDQAPGQAVIRAALENFDESYNARVVRISKVA